MSGVALSRSKSSCAQAPADARFGSVTDEAFRDDKDWTWVLHRSCPECGYSAAGVTPADVAAGCRDAARRWQAVLLRPDAAERPRPGVWSAVEYACHTRDVFTIFVERLGLMLTETAPTFANWDQDETAVLERYHEQNPATVAEQLTSAAEDCSAAFAAVASTDLDRRGVRSNGSQFTVSTLGQYFLHDVVHHLHDVSG